MNNNLINSSSDSPRGGGLHRIFATKSKLFFKTLLTPTASLQLELISWREGQLLLLWAFLIAATTGCTSSLANSESNVPSDVIDRSLPGFTLQDYQGNEVSAADYEGKYLVIHIATTWCPFCNAEAPYLEKLYQDYKSRGVEVLIIDVKEDKALVKKLLMDRFHLSFPVVFDTDGSVAASFAPEEVLPDLARDEVMLASNLLIDPAGKVRFFSLLDTNNFDAKLIQLKTILDELLS